MAYLQATSNNQKMVTMGAVAALHAVALYAVVSGLAVSIIPVIEERITGVNIKQPKPTPPPPPPDTSTRQVDKTVKPVESDPVLPPIGGNPVNPFGFGTTGGEEGAGGGLERVEFPTPPVPQPSPRFTAKGPKPSGNLTNWVRESDYPTVAIRQELEGLTRVKLEVNTAGRVTDCVVTASSGHEVLDNAACAKLIERGRFNPATDTSGQAAAGTFNTSVRWQLPQ